MSRPRVLVFSSLLPLPIDRGDRNRLFHVLRLLSEFADVRLLALERAWEPPPTLSPLGNVEVVRLVVTEREVVGQGILAVMTGRPFMVTRYALPRVARWVQEQIRTFKPDTFWGYQAASFPLLPCARGLRRVVDVVDSPSRYVASTRTSDGVSWSARMAMSVQWRVQWFERQAVRESDVALVNSEVDLRHISRLVGSSDKVMVLENCVPQSLLTLPWQPDPARPPRLLFVGNLAYPPNQAAVRELANEILPRVRRRVPSTDLLICGSRGEAMARLYGHLPGVRFLGFVDDLVSLYRDSSVMVIPVPLVGGTQYKMLEALAVGLPVVTAPVSAEIAGADDGAHLLVADDPAAFAEAAMTLLQDNERARTLSRNGRSLIGSRYTWESKRPLIARALGTEGPVVRPLQAGVRAPSAHNER